MAIAEGALHDVDDWLGFTPAAGGDEIAASGIVSCISWSRRRCHNRPWPIRRWALRQSFFVRRRSAIAGLAGDCRCNQMIPASPLMPAQRRLSANGPAGLRYNTLDGYMGVRINADDHHRHALALSSAAHYGIDDAAWQFCRRQVKLKRG